MTDHHDELNLLLPWYVNGTLAEDESAAVEAHVKACESCRSDLALLQDMNDAVQDAQPVPIVPTPPLRQFLEDIDSTSAEPETRMRRTGWLLAASLVFATIMLGRMVAIGPEAGSPVMFEVATSSAQSNGMQYVLELQFEPETIDERRRAILAGIGADNVSSTRQPDAVRAVVSLPALSLSELEQLTEEIASVDGVRRVDVVALQLPVEVAE